jgi:hypothetical protein
MGYREEEYEEEPDKRNLIIMMVLCVALVIAIIVITSALVKNGILKNDLNDSEQKVIELTSTLLTKENQIISLKKLNDTIKGIEFLTMAKNISNYRNWSYPDYVCTNFSNDLVIAFNKSGWIAETVNGYWYNNITNGTKNCSQLNYERFNCSHTWVILHVPIEATTGEIISPYENQSYN